MTRKAHNVWTHEEDMRLVEFLKDIVNNKGFTMAQGYRMFAKTSNGKRTHHAVRTRWKQVLQKTYEKQVFPNGKPKQVSLFNAVSSTNSTFRPSNTWNKDHDNDLLKFMESYIEAGTNVLDACNELAAVFMVEPALIRLRYAELNRKPIKLEQLVKQDVTEIQQSPKVKPVSNLNELTDDQTRWATIFSLLRDIRNNESQDAGNDQKVAELERKVMSLESKIESINKKNGMLIEQRNYYRERAFKFQQMLDSFNRNINDALEVSHDKRTQLIIDGTNGVVTEVK